jgi:hypothetical protein
VSAPSDDELARWRAVTEAATEDEDGGIIEPADTAFVVVARTAMPALLDEVERLRRLVAAWATEPVEVPLSGPTVVTRPASNFVVMACPKEHDAVAVRGEGPALVLRLLCGDAVMAERSWAIGSTLRRAEVDQWIRDTLAEHWFEPTEPGQ